MTVNMRYRNKWNISELLSLQREYELLELSVQEIAKRHRRSVRAILFRLELEGFISSWDEARGFDLNGYTKECNGSTTETEPETIFNDSDIEIENIVQEMDHDHDDDDDDLLTIISEYETDKHIDRLTERVWNLETSVDEIGSMVKKMFEVLVSNKISKINTSKTSKTKRPQLRKY